MARNPRNIFFVACKAIAAIIYLCNHPSRRFAIMDPICKLGCSTAARELEPKCQQSLSRDRSRLYGLDQPDNLDRALALVCSD